jgi:transglutaminase-like putative cysteine protease
MRLKISHTTEYSYSSPVQYSLQRLRLTPKTGPGQTVLHWETRVEGAKVEVGYEDHFGNHVDLVSTIGDQSSIRITAKGEVETIDNNGITGPHVAYGPLWLYNRETELTKPGPLVTGLAESIEGEDELARCHALMEAIHKAVTYTPGSTGTTTTAEEAVAAQTGVCQDHAHIFISAARSMGLPARYISGYLLMEDTIDQVATHAWAEAYIKGLGWVGFDPSNMVCPDEKYVRIAIGLDFKDASPVSGMVNGIATESLHVAITVEAQGQSQSQSQS